MNVIAKMTFLEWFLYSIVNWMIRRLNWKRPFLVVTSLWIFNLCKNYLLTVMSQWIKYILGEWLIKPCNDFDFFLKQVFEFKYLSDQFKKKQCVLIIKYWSHRFGILNHLNLQTKSICLFFWFFKQIKSIFRNFGNFLIKITCMKVFVK